MKTPGPASHFAVFSGAGWVGVQEYRAADQWVSLVWAASGFKDAHLKTHKPGPDGPEMTPSAGVAEVLRIKSLLMGGRYS